MLVTVSVAILAQGGERKKRQEKPTDYSRVHSETESLQAGGRIVNFDFSFRRKRLGSSSG